MPRVPPRLTANARALRRDATDAERKLWYRLYACGPRLTRQHVIGPYIVDIACRSAKLAVEIDGGQHAEAAARDEARTVFLESLGWQVIRFWNSDVMENVDGVAEAILQAIGDRLEETHP